MAKILVSPAFGAGWSTWANEDQEEFMLRDPALIALAEAKAGVAAVDRLLAQRFGDDAPYTGGWDSIQVVELPDGTPFTVQEYDGYESLIQASSLDRTA